MADSSTPVTTSAPSSSDSTLSLLGDILSSNTARGAVLGSLMSALTSAYKGPGGVNVGVDMSKVGAIPARTTQIPVPRYATYADYGARDVQAPAITPELARALGLPAGIQMPSAAQYTARPQMVSSALPQTVTSAGSGVGVQRAPTLTPKSDTTINPLIGGLLGASIGYLLPQSQSYTASGATNTASSATKALTDKIVNAARQIFSSSYSAPNLYPNGGDPYTVYNPNFDYSNVTDATGLGQYDPNYAYDYKDGGMVAPLMAANGGEVDSSYYTYGKVVTPEEVLNQMAHGGAPKHGGLHVPVVEGRHDYRAGARVTGPGDGQSDDIPAMLADGEYVIDADTVAQLGNGSTKAGSDLLDKFREEIRSHKRSAPVNKIPPPAKSPLAYLKAAQSRSKKNG